MTTETPTSIASELASGVDLPIAAGEELDRPVSDMRDLFLDSLGGGLLRTADLALTGAAKKMRDETGLQQIARTAPRRPHQSSTRRKHLAAVPLHHCLRNQRTGQHPIHLGSEWTD